jgi:hypothetical protein
MGRCQTLDRDARASVAFQDPTFLPFYYYLGLLVPASRVVVIGFGLGLETVSYLKSKPPIKSLLSVHDPAGSYYNPRIGRSNVLNSVKMEPNIIVGTIYSKEFESALEKKTWNTVLICGQRNHDEVLSTLNYVYEHLEEGGVIAIEGTRTPAVKAAFHNFCLGKNREDFFVGSRYGHGLFFR